MSIWISVFLLLGAVADEITSTHMNLSTCSTSSENIFSRVDDDVKECHSLCKKAGRDLIYSDTSLLQIESAHISSEAESINNADKHQAHQRKTSLLSRSKHKNSNSTETVQVVPAGAEDLTRTTRKLSKKLSRKLSSTTRKLSKHEIINKMGSAAKYLTGIASRHKTVQVACGLDTDNEIQMAPVDIIKPPEIEKQSEGIQEFPMHCITVRDLLEFEKLPRYDEVAALNKFIIVDEEETRPIFFVSHQWTAHGSPDPTNNQFRVLKEAVRQMLKGKVVRPDQIFDGVPGIPNKTKFDAALRNGLVWIDYFGIPQAGRTVNQKNTENESDVNSTNNVSTEGQMRAAINSLPTYVSRAMFFIVLAPAVAHNNLRDVDCDFSSWQNRGWCRLEAVIRALSSNERYVSEKYVTVIYSATKIRLVSSADFLYQRSIGCGEFSCCTLDHTVDIDGVPTKIPCDRDKIAPVLSKFFDISLKRLERLRWKDFGQGVEECYSDYRLLLSHEHVIMRGMPNLEQQRNLDTWPKFAAAFRLDVNQPLQESGGTFDWPPLIWAVLSNNLKVVKYLVEFCKANVNEQITVKKGASCFYEGGTAIHLNMWVGHGSQGKEIFDCLKRAGANPYICAKRTKKLRIPYANALAAAMVSGNEEMLLYFCSKFPVKFHPTADPHLNRTDVAAAGVGYYDVVREFDRLGAKFNSRNMYGYNVLAVFVQIPSEYQRTTDTRILDVLYNSGKLRKKDIQAKPIPGVLPALLWCTMRLGFIKNKGLVRMVDELRGGSHLHAAAYVGKPAIVMWLLEHGVNKNRKTRKGKTALDLATTRGHVRCAEILKGNQATIRLYSAKVRSTRRESEMIQQSAEATDTFALADSEMIE